MNITKQEWFNFGIKKGSIQKIENTVCGMGFYTEYENDIEINLKEERFLQILGIGNWIRYGIANNWIDIIGCPEHEINDANMQITPENGIVVHEALYNVRLKIGDYLAATHKPDNKNYFGYMATNPAVIKEIFRVLPNLDTCNSFIDIGCGKGSVLKEAKNYYEYLYGIDINESLIKDCKNNVDNAQISLIPAEKYIIPDKKMHIFIFNPFNNSILKQFLNNNITNIKKNNSIIIYNNIFYSDHLIKLYGMNTIHKGHVFSIYK